MVFLLLENLQIFQIKCLTNSFLVPIHYSFNFLRQAVQKGPFFNFRVSPYSFFDTLASFQLTLTGTGNNKLCYRYVYLVPVVVWLKLHDCTCMCMSLLKLEHN